MGIGQAEFRHVMGHFLSGVTVVTTAWDGQLYGITVSAFSSLSLDPPLVLVCIDRSVRSHEAIARAGQFIVHFLDEQQSDLSLRFASRDDDKFSGLAYRTTAQGLPLLDGVLASVECQVVDALAGGDHTIFVGEVMAAAARDGAPLGYFRGSYRQLA